MVEVRCKYCGRLLMKLNWGHGETKCGKCGRMVSFSVTTQSLDRFLERLKERSDRVAKAVSD